jgi:hypothetical protein
MTKKSVYTSGRDPLSGCEMLYCTEDGKRNGILTATVADEVTALSPAAVLKAAASLLNGHMPDVMGLPNDQRVFYGAGSDRIVMHVKDGHKDGVSVPSVVICTTGSSPDLSQATLSRMNREFMGRMCGMFDGMTPPAPRGEQRAAPAPRPQT